VTYLNIPVPSPGKHYRGLLYHNAVVEQLFAGNLCLLTFFLPEDKICAMLVDGNNPAITLRQVQGRIAGLNTTNFKVFEGG